MNQVTYDLSTLELYHVHPGSREVSPVRCFPSPMLARRLTVLDRTHVLAAGHRVTDRGVTLRVCGRAPWAERLTQAVDVPAWTMVKVGS